MDAIALRVHASCVSFASLLYNVPRRLGESGSRLSAVLLGFAATAALAPDISAAPGALPARFGVGTQGEATYSIPITAPAGTGGLRPTLALTYNHLAGSGLAGMRWTLTGVSLITRCPQTHAQDGAVLAVAYASTDRFCLNGQRLVLRDSTDTYGAAGTEYRTEIETFQHIVQSGSGPDSFAVHHGNGLRSEFGATADSRIEKVGTSAVRFWYLSFTEDQFGNRITYSYDENTTTGEVLPSEILWTSNSGQGLSAKYEVAITYETRPTEDQRSGFDSGGAPWTMTKRIDKIDVIYNGSQVISTYDLTYRTAAAEGTQRSQLGDVSVCRGTDCLPETVFEVQDGTAGWGALVDTSRSAGSNALVGDMNADGKEDLFVNLSGTWQVYLGTADALLSTAIDSGVSSTTNPELARVLDYNGDGRSDLLYQSGSTWRVLVSTGSGFTDTSTGISTTTYGRADIRDFDGDGLGDWLYRSSSDLLWLRNTGGGFGTAATIAVNIPGDPQWVANVGAPDVNGDGRADLIVLSCDTNPSPPPACIDVWTVLVASNGSYSAFAQFAGSATAPISNMRAIDVNGDRLSDIAYVGGTTQTWRLRLSTGTALGSEIDTGIPGIDGDKALIVDYDNDGRGDLLRPDSDYWRIHRSNGATLSSSYTSSLTSSQAASSGAFVIDLSGDGFPEIVRTSGSNWHTHLHQSALPDVVTSFADGLGYMIEVEYESLSNSANYTTTSTATPTAPYAQRFSGPRYVVTTEIHDNGLGEYHTDTTRELEHFYDSAWVDVSGRGWLSFFSHRVEDPDRGTESVVTYNQTFPFAAMVELSEIKRTSDGQVIRRVDPELDGTSWTATTPDRHFVRVERTTIDEYEVGGAANGVHLRTIEDDPVFSTDYGHVIEATRTITDPVTSESWETFTDFDRSVDIDDWCLGLPGLVETTSTLPNSNATVRKVRNAFNADNCRLSTVTDESDVDTAKQLRTVYAYDGFGNVDTVSQDSVDGSADDRGVDFAYDADGQYQTSVTVANVNLTTEFAWNYLLGLRESVTGPDELTTSWSYDPFGRLTNETRPGGGETDFSYADCEACGPLYARLFVFAEGSDGSESYEFFDELQRSVGRSWKLPTGAEGHQNTYYTATGEVESVSKPFIDGENYYATHYSYDLLGRLTQADSPLDETQWFGTNTTYEYRGHEVWITDPRNHTTKYVHNAARQIEAVVDALNGTTEYSYHPFGDLATVEDADGNETTISYDPRGYKASLDDPDMGLWEYEYNVFGELDLQRDALGQEVDLFYDAAGRLYKRIEPEGITLWTYYSFGAGKIGKLDEVTTPDGYSEHYVYSSTTGLPTLVRRVIDSTTYDFDYEYDSEGRVDVMTYPTSTTGFRFALDYDYGSFGHLSQVKDDANPTTVYYELNETDALAQERLVTLGNGLQETRAFDLATSRIKTIQIGPSAAVQDLSYVWDEAGNLAMRKDFRTGKIEDFEYDELDRLQTVTLNSSVILSLDYDAIGNIDYKSDIGTYSYGANGAGPHALTSVTGLQSNSYTYNANGNMTDRDGDLILWHSFNKPKKILYGSDYSQLFYGQDRQRVKQVAVTGSGTGTLHYVGRQFEVLTNGGQQSYMHYIFANGRAIARFTNYNFQGPDTRYLHRDHLGSVVTTTNETGIVKHRFEFDPFGVRTQTVGSGVYTQKGFTGHEHLDAVDLIDMGGRVQDPFTGRFISPDPFVPSPYNSQSLNRYTYVLNNPASHIDPSGFDEIIVWGAAPASVSTYGLMWWLGMNGWNYPGAYGSGSGGATGGGSGSGGGAPGDASPPLEEEQPNTESPAADGTPAAPYEFVVTAKHPGWEAEAHDLWTAYWTHFGANVTRQMDLIDAMSRGDTEAALEFMEGYLGGGATKLVKAARAIPRLKDFERAGIETTEHFSNRLAQRGSRGITERNALDAYQNGRLYYDEVSGNYIRHSSRTGVSVVTDAPSGGRAITVFEGNPSPGWNPVPWRPGQ